MAERVLEIRPHLGPQTAFLSTTADIAFYGGEGGGGKSWALLVEPLRHFENPRFGAVIFRRTTKQVRNEGGLWDKARELYIPMGATSLESTLECKFPTEMRVQFAHLEHEKNVFDYQGAEIPLIGFDEVTHFSELQFWYMLSRNRSTCGVRPYIRATCNADADSWVRKLIDWWIDPSSGLPIPERSGKIRWFIRREDKLHWGDSAEELIKRFGESSEVLPKSFTFIPARLKDNPTLMEKDPGYAANIQALPLVERLRLGSGNWNIKHTAGSILRKEWFPILKALPASVKTVRYWDRAATDPTPKNPDPDYTVGLKLGRDAQGLFQLMDIVRFQGSPLKVETAIKNCAARDGMSTQIWLELDPGQAGKAEASYYSRLLAGYDVKFNRPTADKVTRSKPASAQAESQNIRLLEASWNEAFLSEAHEFPDGKHDDQIDALSGAIHALTLGQAGTFSDQMAREPEFGTIVGSDNLAPEW